ncbi:SIS domain-containing protein [Desertimonas flava]|uniref:SIS domain-containing protein n=1 Tax=Desertimonas flava TaxID=2064846 RepID=UPI000E35435B|nr:SIS domain-containing protein [Desertimonas flava]
MCGIIAIVSRPPTRAVPAADDVVAGLDAALACLGDPAAVADELAGVDRSLRGLPGVLALADRHELLAAITSRLDQLDAYAAEVDAALAGIDAGAAADDLERQSATAIRLKDALWAIRCDRLRTVREVDILAGRGAGDAARAGYLALQQALSAIDRMEVRGRDSAGVHVFLWGHGLDLADPAIATVLSKRSGDPLFQNGSVRAVDSSAGPVLSFAYKAAAEIGELGDNTAAMRAAIASDELLRRALAAPTAQVSVLGHTRWASVGIISEPNAHPVNGEESSLSSGGSESLLSSGGSESSLSSGGSERLLSSGGSESELTGGEQHHYTVGVLNGDVDNHADLKVAHGLRFAGPITTDAKVIPALLARHLDTVAGSPGQAAVGAGALAEAFRRTVAEFEGSVAIGAASASDPGTVLLALKGSGQGVYIGLADDRFIVASEPYGIVEETDRFVRLDGEGGGQLVALDAAGAGTVDGIIRLAYDGSPLPVTDADVVTAEVTTRDIDLGNAPHFLLKEITESPDSFAKTLRGKIADGPDGLLRAVVGHRALPEDVVARLAAGSITRVRVIGQGTAAVAGASMAKTLTELAAGRLTVDAITATELSGFGLGLDMSDTLAVAVSQSGTTTDTNRTVDLLKARGAAVLSIVNRRSSDLTDKADGVLYTSDGRDVEMSVASTKAFYAQVAAGMLLSCAIAEAAGVPTERRRHELLSSLRTLPDAMRTVLARRDVIADAARRFAPTKRYWAVVGNGVNKVAAEEVRIKLSELCYKSIACDITEDKKHIDLSSEPLILVCAAGLAGSTADDVSKEVAIFRAHKATPIVVADDGDVRYQAAATISVPPVDPAVGFVLSTMAGHLFGYEAALAIDASALPLREAREVIERAAVLDLSPDEMLQNVRAGISRCSDEFHDGLRNSRYDGHLEASTAVRLSGLLGDALSDQPIERYQAGTGKVGTPAALLDDLLAALTQAIEELTRPVDAIKHQAKTVTVGISRSDEGVLDRRLVQAVLTAGAGRDVLSYRTLKVLADLDPTVAEVVGFTRYGIDGDTVTVVDRGGISRELSSRVERRPVLSGTKRNVASQREILVARGRSDGRTVIFVPEVKSGVTTGITLLHVRFHERLDAATMRGALQGYDRRYDRLVDWVTETEQEFDDSRLADLDVADLLIAPISETADLWRTS